MPMIEPMKQEALHAYYWVILLYHLLSILFGFPPPAYHLYLQQVCCDIFWMIQQCSVEKFSKYEILVIVFQTPPPPTVTVSSSVYINASSSPPCPMLFSPILLFLFWFCFQREAVTMNNTYQPNNQRITLWCVWINFDADHSEPRLHMDQLSPCKLLTLRAPNFCFSHYQGQEATFLKQKMCAWSTPTILGRSTEVLFDLWSTICVILNLRSIYNERSGWLPFVGNTRSITRERHCAILSC